MEDRTEVRLGAGAASPHRQQVFQKFAVTFALADGLFALESPHD